MSFAIFRKNEKWLLWATVIFSVGIFATFSGFGDLRALLSRQGRPPAGTFTVLPTGQRRAVPVDEFQRTRQSLAILASLNGSDKLEDDEAWAHVMEVADAHAAGLSVSEAEVGEAVGGFARSMLRGQPLTPQSYGQVWGYFRMPSARDFEAFVGELLLQNKWQQLQVQQATIVDADEVYLKWRVDNELFDISAIVIPDLALDAVPEPTPEQLTAYWDGLTPEERASRYSEPRRIGIVYAWAKLAPGEGGVADELLAGVAEPDPAAVDNRFRIVKPERYPDLDAPDDAVRAALAHELKVIAYVDKLRADFETSEAKDAEAFVAAMKAGGLSIERPEGLLDNDQIKALPEIGSEILPIWLGNLDKGKVHFGRPWGAQDNVHVVYVTDVQASRPYTLDEARDEVVADWKESRRELPAQEWRDAVRAAAAALPEAVEALAPIREAAARHVEEELAAAGDLDEAGREALRKQLEEETETQEIRPRLAEFEAKVWETVPLPAGATTLVLDRVPRSYARNPDPADAADSIARFVKTRPEVFQLAVGGLSEPLHDDAAGSSVIARVTARSFPDKEAMAADPKGFEAARKSLGYQRRSEASQEQSPERIVAAHALEVPPPEEPAKQAQG